MAGGRVTRVHRPRLRFDLLTWLVGAVGLLVYSLHGFNGVLSRDLGIYSYAGQQVFEGVPPYEGILNRAGPLAHWLPGLGVLIARIGGLDDVFGMRLLFLLFAVAGVCMVYLLGRDVFGSKAAGLASAAAFLSFHGIIAYASGGPREKTPMLLMLLVSAWAVHHRRWLGAGVALSLATLILQISFPVGLAIALVGLIAVQAGDRLRSAVQFAFGGIVPVVVCIVYFTAAGALQTAFAAFWALNSEYNVGNSITRGFATNWWQLEGGYGASLWVALVGVAAIVLLGLSELGRSAVQWWRTRDRPEPAAVSTVGLAVAALVAIAWMFLNFDDWPDAMTVLPWAALAYGGVVKALSRHLAPRRVLALSLVWIVAGVAMALNFSVGQRDQRLTAQRQSVTTVMAELPDDASMLSINAPQPMVFAHKTNPTRYQTLSGGLGRYMNDTWPGGLEGYANWIDEQRPTVIAVGGSVPAWLRGTLSDGYQRVGNGPGWVWFVDRSVGQKTLRALKHVS
jgi:hypothetical protein